MTRVFAPVMAVTLGLAASAARAADLKLGIVGTDTSHVVAFTRLLNDPSSPDHIPGARIVAAYKGGSPDLASSRDRIDGFTRELQEKFGVEIVGTIAELCKRVDGVLLESVDGRSHLAQAREVIAAGKPLFIDKPLAATLDDAREIARLAKHAGVAWFSTSSLRYAVANLKTANLSGADVWGPGPLEEHHQLDLSWYAIHEAEMLYTLMGTGCEEVTRIPGPDADVVACRWKDGRIGTMRERDRLAGRKREIHVLFAVRESRLAERIRREESVSARVPVRRVSRVRGVIEDGERHRLAVDRASQHHPSCPCAPHLVAGLA